ncbi:MAG: hypothetical protein ABIS30_10875 [Gallionella sp.]
MRYKLFPAGLFILLFLEGCAGAGIVATSDPDQKMRDAYYLINKGDRPLPAETLISEATAIYQSQNNSRGLGTAYAGYGDLLTSPTLAKWGSKNTYFHDKSVTFDNRIALSTVYYTKSIEAYQVAASQAIETEQFDVLTNIYLNMARISYELHDIKKTCDLFNKSFGAYTENIRRNPTAKPIATGFNSIPELIATRKKNVGCA